MSFDLFSSAPLQLAPDVWLLKGFAASKDLLTSIEAVASEAPFRHYAVPGGKSMSVAMTNCGRLGWVSSAQGYAYLPHDPDTLRAWPDMPEAFARLATDAARQAGWAEFEPDACLINRYAAGAGMGMHQDRDEQDLSAPIVSVSIGASCKFMLGGLRRSDAVKSIDLHDGDVMVWGGSARLVFHGVRPLQQDQLRYNLTFRKAG
jgi:DNA oxidative demethylase